MNTPTRLAEWAWDKVDQATKLSARGQGHYGRLARRLPSWLSVNGLGQTVAFLYAKGHGTRYEGAEGLLLRQLGEVLESSAAQGEPRGSADPMQQVITMSTARYRLATRRALAASLWLKRLAEARLDSDESEAG